METVVVLQVEGVDLMDAAVLDVLAEHFSDIAWQEVAGAVTATLFTDSAEVVLQAVRFAVDLPKRLPHAQVLGVDEQLVSVGDIADRVGVTSEAVRLWTAGKRRATSAFPAARGTISQGRTSMKIWAWPDVVAWLRREYKLDLEPGQVFLSRGQVALLNAYIGGQLPAPAAGRGSAAWRRVGQSPFQAVLHRIDNTLATGVPGRVSARQFACQ